MWEWFVWLAAAVCLVGIPGMMGFYRMARDLGRGDATVGIVLGVYAVGIGAIVVLMGPRGHLESVSSFSSILPPVLLAAIVLGVVTGLKKRREG